MCSWVITLDGWLSFYETPETNGKKCHFGLLIEVKSLIKINSKGKACKSQVCCPKKNLNFGQNYILDKELKLLVAAKSYSNKSFRNPIESTTTKIPKISVD